MLGNLKSSGAQLQAEVHLIAKSQGMKNLPSAAPSVPLSFGPGSHHTHPLSSSGNAMFLAAKQITLETNIQNLQSAASGQAAQITKL